MSWNDNLYVYAQARGGEYFGGPAGGWSLLHGYDAQLLLEYRGGSVIVHCETISGGRGSASYTAQVLLRCELERNYSLEIRPKNTVRQGLNTMLGQLDKGAALLNQDVDLYRDYGFPEVTQGRAIKTDDPEFTQMVLRDLELRTCLLDQPKYGVKVGRNTPAIVSSGTHLITAWSNVGGIYSDWDVGEVDTWMSREEQQKQLAQLSERNFFPKLDALIDLAKVTQRAVTAWRMPVK